MYVYLLCQLIEKSETSAELGNKAKIQKQKWQEKRQQPKPCNASQVNQTTNRDEKAYGAIALQLVRAPMILT